jgi:hypothetical protein
LPELRPGDQQNLRRFVAGTCSTSLPSNRNGGAGAVIFGAVAGSLGAPAAHLLAGVMLVVAGLTGGQLRPPKAGGLRHKRAARHIRRVPVG